MLTLVTGGARSGKSRAAERLASAGGSIVTYVATATSVGPDGTTDPEMVDRIARHRRDRPEGWPTVEAPIDLAAAMAAAASDRPLLVDCLTVWLGNVMFDGASDGELRAGFDELASVAAARTAPTVIVTNEVGGGLVPMDALSRRYRDLHGWMNQAIADRADRVVLCVAGRVVDLATIHSLGPDPSP